MTETGNWVKYILIVNFLLCQLASSEISTYEDDSDFDLPLADWAQLESEVQAMLSEVSSCKEKYYSCKEGRNFRRLCSCQDNCMTYGDCCPDLINTQLSGGEEKPNYNFTCNAAGHRKRDEGSLMIASCQEAYFSTNLEDLCHKWVPAETYDHTLDMPAISMSSNLTYQNQFCAACNNDSNHLSALTITVNCAEMIHNHGQSKLSVNANISDILSRAEYIPNELRWKISNSSIIPDLTSDDNIACSLKIREFENPVVYRANYGGRSCHISLPDDKTSYAITESGRCHEDWDKVEDIIKCSYYSLLLEDTKNSVLYKNPHCAACNFVNISSPGLKCANPFLSVRRTDFTPRIPQISVLFQIDGDHSGKCQPQYEIWDPLTGSCKRISCGSSYYRQGKKCVPKSTIFKPKTSNPNCSTVILNSNPIIDLGNSYLTNGTIYDYNQYELNITDGIFCPTVHKRNTFLIQDSSISAFVLIAISEICLVLHIILYWVKLKEQTWNSRNLLFLTISLFFAQLIFMFGLTYTDNFYSCFVISIFLHFFWLATFFWMNVLSIDVFKTFRSQTGVLAGYKYKTFVRYNMYAWGVPIVIVSSSVGVDLLDKMNPISPAYASHNGRMLCWINNPGGLVAFFLGPVAILILVNFVLFLITSWEILSQRQKTKFARIRSQSVRTISSKPANREKQQIRQLQRYKFCCFVYMKLGILQGITWSLIFLTTFINSEIADILFSVCNSLQGTLIFVLFDIKPMWTQSIWSWFSRRSQDSKKSSLGSTKTTSTSTIMNSAMRVK